MHLIRALFFFALTITGALFAKDDASAIQLGYHLQPGDSYSVNFKNIEVMNLTIDHESLVIIQKDASEWTVDILNVDKKGIIKAQATLTHTNPDVNQEIDQDLIDKLLDVTKKNPIQFTFTTTGQISNITGYESLRKLMVEKDERLAPLGEFIFSQDVMERVCNQFICHYPKTNQQKWSTKQGGFYPQNLTYQLASFDESSAYINFHTKFSSSSHINIGSTKLQFKFKGDADGMCVVDRASGWLLSSTKKGKSSGKVTLTTPGDSISCPFTSEFEQVIESTKL